jgi:mannose-6-phosphate isomerase-like protein (cupin superfamily)
MADYTHLNLKEVEDQAPKFGLSELEFRSAKVPLELEHAGISYLRIAPNYRMPFGHNHKTQEEVYVLVSGSLRMKLEEDIIDLKPFDAVRVPKGTMRGFEGGPEGAEVIAIGAPRTGSGDAVTAQEWWSD